MIGIKYLLDTNIIIGLCEHRTSVLDILSDKSVSVSACAYSAITRMELLSFSRLTREEQKTIEILLSRMHYLAVTRAIEDETIAFRRAYQGKLPDAIIASTAVYHKLELLTLDVALAKKCLLRLSSSSNHAVN
jgi:predicted nucleic acid-binding protein